MGYEAECTHVRAHACFTLSKQEGKGLSQSYVRDPSIKLNAGLVIRSFQNFSADLLPLSLILLMEQYCYNDKSYYMS